MSKWDEAHTEPLHDHPAEKDQLSFIMQKTPGMVCIICKT